MSIKFNDLGISAPILKAIEEMGFEQPTEVQSRAIPHILEHKDLIVMSKTGSGKTAVFGVSMLQMTDPNEAGPQGLILTPTRELAVQVDSDLQKMAKHLTHKTAAVYGQHSMNIEVQALTKGVTIVTGTPGRVFDHIQHGHLKTKQIRFLVLDEADRMLDMGFIDQVVKIIKTLPRDRITLLFSATIPPEVKRICTDYMKTPYTIEIESPTKTVDTIRQLYYRVEPQEKQKWLNRLLLMERPESCMIFCNTKHAVDRVQRFLTQKGYACQALHGDIAQGRRLKTIEQFKSGEFRILVATDVAARGIHIEDLSLVINYDVPLDKDSYVHRIGRTGRAGNEGRALSLVTSDDIMSLYEIEEHINAMIEEGELPSEEAFNAKRAEADEWVKANALKVRPSQGASEGGRQQASQQRSRKPGDAEGRNGRPQASDRNRGTKTASDRNRQGNTLSHQGRPVSPVSDKAAYTKTTNGTGMRASTSDGQAPRSDVQLRTPNSSSPQTNSQRRDSSRTVPSPTPRDGQPTSTGAARAPGAHRVVRASQPVVDAQPSSKPSLRTGGSIPAETGSSASGTASQNSKKSFFRKMVDRLLGK
ncbi:MAG: DEAD/DEAH box helicase [Clostridia bacterium]|nr:DEAD/DEAH box helicase [Clostridia bacterium]